LWGPFIDFLFPSSFDRSADPAILEPSMEKFGYGVISECRFRVTDVALWVKMAADVSYGDFGLPTRGIIRLQFR
jgi:hypothetical protein